MGECGKEGLAICLGYKRMLGLCGGLRVYRRVAKEGRKSLEQGFFVKGPCDAYRVSITACLKLG